MINIEIDRAINDLLGIKQVDQPLHVQAMFEECWRAIEDAGVDYVDVAILTDGADHRVTYGPPAKLPEQIYGRMGELSVIVAARHQWTDNLHVIWSTIFANPYPGVIPLGQETIRAILVSEINDQENTMVYDQFGNHIE